MSIRDAFPAPTAKNVPAERKPADVDTFADKLPQDLGPKMMELSDREKRFVIASLMPDVSGAQAARIAGFGAENTNAEGFARIAWRLKHENRRVAAAIVEVADLALRNLSVDAVKALGKIVRQDFHKDQAKVALSLAERASPTIQRQDINVKVEHVDHDAEMVKALRAFKAQGAARDFLEGWFGYGGLMKYEKLIAQEDAAQAITVDYTEIKPEADPKGDSHD